MLPIFSGMGGGLEPFLYERSDFHGIQASLLIRYIKICFIKFYILLLYYCDFCDIINCSIIL